MKKFSKVLVAVLVTLLSLTSARVNVSAEPTPPPTAGEDSEYEERAGEIIKFKKYLISEMGQVVPELEFKYEVTAGTAQEAAGAKPAQPAVTEAWIYNEQEYATEEDAKSAADTDQGVNPGEGDYSSIVHREAQDAKDAVEGLFEIKAGLEPEKVVVGSAQFNDSISKFPSVQTGDTLTLEEGDVYQVKEVNVDFSGVKFPEPGVYRYVLTEKEISDQTRISYDTQRKEAEQKIRIIDVYVVDDGTGVLKIDKTTVLHEVATSIKTSDEMGSKDPKATVAVSWALPEGLTPTDPTDYNTMINNPYNSLEAAEAARISVREKIHDDIVSENKKIDDRDDDLNKAVADAEAALNEAKTAQDVDGKKQAYDAKTAEKNTIQNNINTKLAELAVATEPTLIQSLRDEIDDLRTDLATVEAEETIAKNAYENAKTAVQDKQDAYDNAVAAVVAVQNRIAALQTLYNSLGQECIEEIAWKLSDKSDGFVNKLSPVFDLQFHKKVTGNQGSKDKYFKFTLTIEGLAANQLVTLDSTAKWTKEPSKTAATSYDADVMKAANSIDEDTKYKYGTHEFDTQTDAELAAIDGEKQLIVDDTAGTTGKWIYDGNQYDTEAEAQAAAEATAPSKVVAPLNGQQLKADENGKIEKSFYLKDDEYIKVLDLKEGVTYKVDEDEEDYGSVKGTDKKAYSDNSPEIQQIDAAIAAETDTAKKAALNAKKTAMLAKVHDDPTSGTLNKSVYTGYTNTRNGILPTGVAVAAGAGLVMLGIGAAGMLLFGKRKEDDEDED